MDTRDDRDRDYDYSDFDEYDDLEKPEKKQDPSYDDDYDGFDDVDDFDNDGADRKEDTEPTKDAGAKQTKSSRHAAAYSYGALDEPLTLVRELTDKKKIFYPLICIFVSLAVILCLLFGNVGIVIGDAFETVESNRVNDDGSVETVSQYDPKIVANQSIWSIVASVPAVIDLIKSARNEEGLNEFQAERMAGYNENIMEAYNEYSKWLIDHLDASEEEVTKKIYEFMSDAYSSINYFDYLFLNMAANHPDEMQIISTAMTWAQLLMYVLIVFIAVIFCLVYLIKALIGLKSGRYKAELFGSMFSMISRVSPAAVLIAVTPMVTTGSGALIAFIVLAVAMFLLCTAQAFIDGNKSAMHIVKSLAITVLCMISAVLILTVGMNYVTENLGSINTVCGDSHLPETQLINAFASLDNPDMIGYIILPFAYEFLYIMAAGMMFSAFGKRLLYPALDLKTAKKNVTGVADMIVALIFTILTIVFGLAAMTPIFNAIAASPIDHLGISTGAGAYIAAVLMIVCLVIHFAYDPDKAPRSAKPEAEEEVRVTEFDNK